MSTRKFISALALAGSVLAPTVAVAAKSPSPHALCILDEYQVTSVRPYRTEEHIGRAAIRKMRGAEVYVQAQPGLTAEWLRLRLARHVADMQRSDMRDCALDLSQVQVDVESSGGGFWVKLSGANTKDAQEILRRAQLLLDR
jgi:hypothetical protein